MVFREFENAVKRSLSNFPVTALIGSRQVGKTTLARSVGASAYQENPVHLDLENPRDLAKLSDPISYLERQAGKLVILDEIQRCPEIFPVLRVLADAGGYRFLILGSSSPELMRQSSESLAGRINYLELPPFSLGEIGATPQGQETLWTRGGYPRSYLAPDGTASLEWRRAFIRTFLERDLPQFGIRVPAPTLRRFWSMAAHHHGRIWNGSTFAQSLDISVPTAKHHLDILQRTFILRVLEPFLPNLKKRLVKSPKIYFRDSGLLHEALDLPDMDSLSGHPSVGASWEGFAIEQIIRRAPMFSRFHYYRTQAGAEVDLVESRPGKKPILYEMKYSTAPKVGKGLRSAMEDLDPEKVFVVHPGRDSFPMDERIEALSLLEWSARGYSA